VQLGKMPSRKKSTRVKKLSKYVVRKSRKTGRGKVKSRNTRTRKSKLSKPRMTKPRRSKSPPRRSSKRDADTFTDVYDSIPGTLKHVIDAPKTVVLNASQTMTMTELQLMAKSKGIPFGGLNKTRLIHKINNYL
jgi:hypothetical protein